MIDLIETLELLKIKKDAPVIHLDLVIQALSEAKEIIEYFNECPYDLDKASIPKSGNLDLDQVVGNMSVARKKEQLLGQWLTRYFPDTRKEEV